MPTRWHGWRTRWARGFQEQGSAGDLEVAVTETLARPAGAVPDLPDHQPARRSRRPQPDHPALVSSGSWVGRPQPGGHQPSGASVVDRLADLHTGPWWPDLDRLLAGIDRILPEQFGQAGTPSRTSQLVEPS